MARYANNQNLNGLSPLSYMGVNASSPSQFIQRSFAPSVNDWQNFEVGATWLYVNENVNPQTQQLYMLTSLVGNQAKWILVSGSSGQILQLTADDAGHVLPIAGNINIIGAVGGNLTSASTIGTGTIDFDITGRVQHALQVGSATGNLSQLGVGGTGTILVGNTAADPSFSAAGITGTVLIGNTAGIPTFSATPQVVALQLPVTTGALIGVITIGGNRFVHSYGLANTFVGDLSGTFVSTGLGANSGFGAWALGEITTGTGNTAIGVQSSAALLTGVNNVSLGGSSLLFLLSGSRNIAIGADAGIAFVGAESDCIMIGSQATAGESNTIRIGGGTGVGVDLQDRCFISGIRGITTLNVDAIAVLIDSAGQLGTVSSSRKLKDNIIDMADYSDVIHALRPVIFNYKSHAPESISFGLIAEEVAEVAPKLTVFKDGEPETVKYLDLIPMLLNEVQKLRKELNELKSKS